tara:strand:+ start:3124 stop:3249 length:126 start_codon:yes stop_codon:yes gene_type:complete
MRIKEISLEQRPRERLFHRNGFFGLGFKWVLVDKLTAPKMF